MGEVTEVRQQLEACHVRAFQWAMHCCEGDRGEAEDVLQSAYLKVLDGRARFDGRSSFSTWLFSVIWRTAADEFRRRRIRVNRYVPLADGESAVTESPGPAERAESAERRRAITAALDRLPLRQREVLLLVFYHERTIEEAAAVIGIGLGSARTHYARGKARLRELLEGTEVHDDR
jgi:RNA polymerase sigma-70 factor (ECF subfamily)